jgi:hypothetical protein
VVDALTPFYGELALWAWRALILLVTVRVLWRFSRGCFCSCRDVHRTFYSRAGNGMGYSVKAHLARLRRRP